MLLFCGSLPESFKSSDEGTRVNEPLGKEESVADHSQRTLPGTMIMRTLCVIHQICVHMWECWGLAYEDLEGNGCE